MTGSSKKECEAIFVVSAGPRVGWGHYVRSQTLANDLVSAGVRVHFYVMGRIPQLPRGNVSVSLLGQDFSKFRKHVTGTISVALFDLYEFSSGIAASLKSFPVSVVIDDGSHVRFPCDLLVNPNVNEEFEHRLSSRTKYLSGGKHVLLRPQFDHVVPRRCKKNPDHLLVALGGTDPAHLIIPIVRCLRKGEVLSFERITVLLADRRREQALRKATRGDDRFRILYALEDVCFLLKDADVGILAGGTMLHEAAATGLPVLVVSLNEPQSREARAFHKHGAAVHLGDAALLDPEAIMGGLKKLFGKNGRQQMADKAQSLVDGQGRRRVARAILGLARRKYAGSIKPRGDYISRRASK